MRNQLRNYILEDDSSLIDKLKRHVRKHKGKYLTAAALYGTYKGIHAAGEGKFGLAPHDFVQDLGMPVSTNLDIDAADHALTGSGKITSHAIHNPSWWAGLEPEGAIKNSVTYSPDINIAKGEHWTADKIREMTGLDNKEGMAAYATRHPEASQNFIKKLANRYYDAFT